MATGSQSGLPRHGRRFGSIAAAALFAMLVFHWAWKNVGVGMFASPAASFGQTASVVVAIAARLVLIKTVLRAPANHRLSTASALAAPSRPGSHRIFERPPLRSGGAGRIRPSINWRSPTAAPTMIEAATSGALQARVENAVRP